MSVKSSLLLPALLGLGLSAALLGPQNLKAEPLLQNASTPTRIINLPVGRSMMVDLPVDASDVFISNPKIADAVLRTPKRIFVMATQSGQTDAVFIDRMGKQILNLSIRVEANTDQVLDTIKHLYPQSRVELTAANGNIILSGMAANAAEAVAIAKIAGTFVASEDKVVNLMTIAGKDQVMVKVRVVEVDHTAVKQLGLNMTAILGGSVNNTWGFSQAANFAANGSYLGTAGLTRNTTSAVGGAKSLNAQLLAFERAGISRTLAEPDVITTSGETSKFLAGGEFPVPTAFDPITHTLTVSFKEYGVGLGIAPVVMSNGNISIKVSTEISELTNIGSVTTTGISVPGLTKRSSDNTVELGDGQSIMLAGLLQSKYNANIDSLPGLATLPVLGSLFRSRDFLNDQTELVIILTAYLVHPTSPDKFQTPGDNLIIPNDLEQAFLGQLNKPNKSSSAHELPPTPAPTGSYQAPVGYVIE